MKECPEGMARREQIVDAALAIVIDHGVGAMTVRRVAERVGLTAPALYKHYKNKADLMDSVLAFCFDLFMAAVAEARAEADTPLGVLRGIFRRNISLLQRYRALPVIFLSDQLWLEAPQMREHIRKDSAAYQAEISGILEQGQAAGQIRGDIASRELYINFLGLYVTPGMMASRPMTDIDLALQAEVNWRLFEDAVAL